MAHRVRVERVLRKAWHLADVLTSCKSDALEALLPHHVVIVEIVAPLRDEEAADVVVLEELGLRFSPAGSEVEDEDHKHPP